MRTVAKQRPETSRSVVFGAVADARAVPAWVVRDKSRSVHYSVVIAWRNLRARKRASVSVIGGIAIFGIMLGVGALSAVLAVTSGFQAAFREKVLGVNAHLLVMKYGWDFTEYREVIQHLRTIPGVVGAAPFLINPMMITRGDRIAGVLVKGVDPELLGQVLDLPSYLAEGSLRGLRRPGATPPIEPGDERESGDDTNLDDWIRRSRANLQAAATRHDTSSVPPDPFAGADLPDLPTLRDVPGTVRDAHPAPLVEPLLPAGALPAYVGAPPAPITATADPLAALSNQIQAQAAEAAHAILQSLPGVVVGRTLARNLDLHLGDQVRIISPLTGADAALVRHGNTPRARDFRVVGIFDAGFDEYDSRLVYVDLWEAQRFFDQGNAVTGVEVKVADIERAAALGRRIDRELGGSPYHSLDWETLNHNLFTALRLQKLGLSIVITIIIIVAAFNVVATLVMIVLERRREIAILKAMGADEAGILYVFLLQGLAVGMVGTLLGLALGAGICLALVRLHFPLDPQVYLIRFVPVRASPFEFALTALVALTISLLASLIPAWWAARLAPVEGLRYE